MSSAKFQQFFQRPICDVDIWVEDFFEVLFPRVFVSFQWWWMSTSLLLLDETWPTVSYLGIHMWVMRLSLFQVMAGHLFGTRLLPEPSPNLHWLDPQPISMKFYSRFKHFHQENRSLHFVFVLFCSFCFYPYTYSDRGGHQLSNKKNAKYSSNTIHIHQNYTQEVRNAMLVVQSQYIVLLHISHFSTAYLFVISHLTPYQMALYILVCIEHGQLQCRMLFNISLIF